MKKEIKSIPYNLDNKDYQIKVFETDEGYLVQAFENDNRADIYSYTANRYIKNLFELQRNEDILSHLIESAKEGLKIFNKYFKNQNVRE